MAAALQRQEKTDQRLVLAGVPRVGFYTGRSSGTNGCANINRCPENLPFPSCLRAILDYLGEDLGYRLIAAHNSTWRLDHTFTYLMGVSGCAFRLSWKPGWSEDNANIRWMSDDPGAPYERALAAVGYRAAQGACLEQSSELACRQAITSALRAWGRPLIAFGVIGPPEACLITGYDEDGRVLIGWNYFQDDPRYNAGVAFEPSGEFRKRNWYSRPLDLLILGEKQTVPDPAREYRSALRWALDVMRVPRTNGGRYNGCAAFSAWAESLQMDQAFPPGQIDVLRQRFRVHDSMVGTLAEARWYAARFMEMAAASEPALEDDLLDAADCFEDEHDLMWQAWGLVGGSGQSDDRVLRLANARVRREVGRLITRAREQDLRAAACIERALQAQI